MYTTEFTKNVTKELIDRGANDFWLHELAKQIEKLPRGPGLDVDMSDNAISFAGYPLSFLRNHKTKEILVHTNEEGAMMDDIAKRDDNYRLQ